MRRRPRITGGVLISVLVGLAATHYLIYRVGTHRGRNRAESRIYAGRDVRNQWVEYVRPLEDLLGRLGFDPGVLEMAGHPTYHSQWGQDRWVAEKVFPGVKDGYFVDVGSGHGIKDSNTKALEALGWSGVCVDPFPQGMEARRCEVFAEVAYSSTGHTVSFTRAGHLGGIRDHLSLWASDKRLAGAETVELTTTTMDEILERAQAPRYLHYVSLDVEGAEYEVLQGLDLAKYQVGALTVEHNFEERKRSRIQAYLKKRGYRLAMSMKYDDWYLPAWGPDINVGGVVDAAQFSPTVVPGGIAALFGAELADGPESAADSPLPLELQGARVFVDGQAAPLLFVSKRQINFQVPYGVGEEGTAEVVVWHNGFYSVAETVAVGSPRTAPIQ